MLCFFSFLRCGCRTANGRRKGRAADAGGFCLFGQHVVGGVTVTASQGMNMVMLVLKGMYMAFVGEGCQSQGKRRREIAMVAMSNLDSSFVI